jgi:hypothetical protein
MDDQPLAGAEAATGAPSASAPSPASGGDGGTKECALCGSSIVAWADRCAHCGGFLPIVEGRAYPQHFFFFTACLALFLGTLLPWEGAWMDSNGYRSFGGAFLLVFAGYGMVASFFNIFHRQMIVWPAILAAFDGAFVGWQRLLQILASPAAKAISWDGDLPEKKKALLATLDLFGPGLLVVVAFSTMFWFVFVIGIVQGGRTAAARKEAEKAARAASRKK